MRICFASDDFIWLYDASGFQGVGDLFLPHYFNFVRPVTNLFFWACYRAFGLDPGGYHIVVLVLYVLTGWMLGLLVRSAGGRPGAGLLSGLMFVAYPYHWASVSWPAAVGEVLVGFFMMACLLSFLTWRRDGRTVMLWSAVLCLVGALLSKEAAIVLPLLVLLADLLVVPQLHGSWRGVVRRHWFFWGLTALVYAWEGSIMVLRRDQMGYGSAATDPRFYWTWLYDSLSTAISFSWVDTIQRWLLASGGDALVRWSGVVLWFLILGVCWKRAPAVACWMLYIAATCFPYAYFRLGGQMYERYTYLPSLGVAALAVSLAMLPASSKGRTGGIVAILCLLLWAGDRAWDRAVRYAVLMGTNQAEVPTLALALERWKPEGHVYVYVEPDYESFPQRFVALWGGVPMPQIKDWYELLRAADLPEGDVAVFWDETTRTYTDVTDAIRSTLRALAQTGRFPLQVSGRLPQAGIVRRSWSFDRPQERSQWSPVEGLSFPSRADRIGAPASHSGLESPPLGSPPLTIYAVQVLCRVHSLESLAGEQVVGWVGPGQAGSLQGRMVSRPLPARGGDQILLFFPTYRLSWWQEPSIQRLILVPSTVPGNVEILNVSLFMFLGQPP